MSNDALTTACRPGVGRVLISERDGMVVAKLTEFADDAWLSRLARVPLLEDALRKALTAKSFVEWVASREEMAKLAADIETCLCRRIVSAEDRCASCGACPACEAKRPCPTEDVDREIAEMMAVARIHY